MLYIFYLVDENLVVQMRPEKASDDLKKKNVYNRNSLKADLIFCDVSYYWRDVW